MEEHRQQLLDDAKKQGRQAEAIIATANNLLESAREMSRRGASSNGGSVEYRGKTERLKAAQQQANDAMEEDMERLAKAKLVQKGLTGVEGVDQLSRAQEKIQALDRKLNDMGETRR